MADKKEISINRNYYIALAVFFILYCLFLSWSFLFQNVDDAYISFRYGKNLMSGLGLVYNKGEYLEGYTNFLWTIITAPFTKVNFIDVSRFAIVLGLLISLLNIVFITRISKVIAGIFPELSAQFLLLPVLFYVLDDSMAFWAIGGMEFPLYVLLILGITYFYFKINDKPGNYIILFLFLALCTLNRPEGNLIFTIVIVHSFFYRKSINNYFRKIFIVCLLYTIFAALYYGFKYFYYGQVIPNTFYAKGVTDALMNLWLGFKYLVLGLGTRCYIFFFILFLPFKKVFKDYRLSYLIVFSFMYLLYLWCVGGDWMIANRFFVPVIPILYILSSIGFVIAIQKFISHSPLRQKYRDRIFNLSTAMICVFIFFVTMGLLEYRELIIKDENYKYEMQWSMFGKWLKMNTAPNTIIAVGPAGKIPYYSELYTIDMWGLNNEHIAKTRSKRLAAGHKKFDFDYVLSLKPEFIIGYAGFTDSDMPQEYEKFNAPEEEYKSIDVVFRLKPQYRNNN